MLLCAFGAIICSEQETLETPTATLTFAQTPSRPPGFQLRGCVPPLLYQKPPNARGSMRFSTASRWVK